jgi:MoxR-like ATPase
MNKTEEIISNISQVIKGKREVITRFVTGILAGGHILFEDVPGTGKTTLVKAFAKSCDIKFTRIQCTPDLLPSDITGITIYSQQNNKFYFQRGPVFTNLLLADEINRTSPKTQSALLEVMEENQVTENNRTYVIEKPFIVAATQNPLEHQGTYRLPEAQLDRFMMKLIIGYADSETEIEIIQNKIEGMSFESIVPVITREGLQELMNDTLRVAVSPQILQYSTILAEKTRISKYINHGISTRALISLVRCAQATAYINGRNFCIPDDIKENIHAIIRHRIFLSPLARSENMDEDDVITHILERTVVPGV